MPDEAAVILARLRGHAHDCRRQPWGCRPERGQYCSTGRPMYNTFYDVRRAEVLAARVERLMRGAPIDDLYQPGPREAVGA